MEQIVRGGFRLTAVAHRRGHGDTDPHEHYQVMHSPRVLLVDREGVVRGFYDTTDPDEMSRFKESARAPAVRAR